MRGTSQSGIGLGPARHVSLEEVLEAGTENLRLSIDLASENGLDFESLDEAISATESRLTSAATREQETDVGVEERDGGIGVVTNEIHCLVALLEAGTTTPVFNDPERAALERASILLHEAHQAIGFDTQKYGRTIDVILQSVGGESVERFARLAITDLCEQLPHSTFDAWLPAVLPAARRASGSLCDWLAAIAANVNNHGREALWPFMIDDLLVNLKGRQKGLEGDVWRLDPLAQGTAIERLCQLPAIARSVFAPGVFSQEQTFMHDLLIRLMDGPARLTVGPVLLAAFKDTLPADPGVSFCLFAARQYDESIGWLLAEQLHDLNAAVSMDTQRTAAWILMSAIDNLHPERRREVWIPGALEWLGSRDQSLDSDVQRDAAKALFNRISSERDGLRKVWSRDCRRTAAQALKDGGFA